MDNLNEIFDPADTTDDSVDDLDRELATTGLILQKLAEEQGVDLDSLPEEDIADLITSLHGEDATGGSSNYSEHEPQTKEASHNMSQENEFTVADVAVELAKVAASEGIDLDQVSRDEYHEAFEALADQMSDPAYFQKRAEAEEKLAEADLIGRHMARSFIDEMEKEAAPSLKGAKKALKGLRRKAEDLEFRASAGTGRLFRGGKKGRSSRLDEMMESARDAGKKVTRDQARDSDEYASRTLGRKILGGGAAATGIGAGGYAAGRSKKSFDESFESDAVSYANHLLVDNGLISPTRANIEFSKFAAYAGEEYTSAVEARAIELLGENGWLED